jgi:hypothetical protein
VRGGHGRVCRRGLVAVGVRVSGWLAACVLVLVAAGATPAAADVVVFDQAGQCVEWQVPLDVTRVHVLVVGAHGGYGLMGGHVGADGGAGDAVSAQLEVRPGTFLRACVNFGGRAGGSGAGNGGGRSDLAGGGGTLIVAGGGGGGGAGGPPTDVAVTPIAIAFFGVSPVGGSAGYPAGHAGTGGLGSGGGGGGPFSGGAGGAGGGEAGFTFSGGSGAGRGGGGGGGHWGGGGGGDIFGAGSGGGGGGSDLCEGVRLVTVVNCRFAPARGRALVELSFATPFRANAAPTVSIEHPSVVGSFFSVGQVARSLFKCEDRFGPGIARCVDQDGRASGSLIDTSAPGLDTLRVTATSEDGLSRTESVIYTVFKTETVQLEGFIFRLHEPGTGARYELGQRVLSSFTCSGGSGEPALSCLDQNGRPSGDPIDTSSVGEHTFTVTGTFSNGQTPSFSRTYLVLAPPSVSIARPTDGATFERGLGVDSSFTCVEGEGGPGLSRCVDQHDHPSGERIDTSIVGRHQLTVTALSTDGLSSTRSVSYTVVTRPTVNIVRPATGETLRLGEEVLSEFDCHEGEEGPGLARCVDQNGHGPGARVDTSTIGPLHRYTVTATSRDGLEFATRTYYRVAAGPTVEITTPATDEVFALGQRVDSKFSCSEGAGGDGIALCADEHERGTGTPLQTGKVGEHTLTVTALSHDRLTTSVTVRYTVRPPTPQLREPRLTTSALPEGSAAVIVYRDSLPGRTTFRVYRKLPGVRRGGRCTPPPRGTRARRFQRCTRFVLVGTFTHHDRAGLDRLRFTGKLNGRRLKPGFYQLRATSTLAGHTSQRRTINIRILPNRKPSAATPTISAATTSDNKP